jgi:hypothetical protein
MAPPYVEKPAPALAGNRLSNSDWLAGAINKTDKPNGHPSQAQRCEHCQCRLSQRKRGGPGRKQRFCSTACRVASKREKERFESAGYNHPACNEIASKTANKSNGCEPENRHPYPCRFTVPIDVLGKGHRWAGAPRLDRAKLEAIRWREIGGD